MLSHGCFVDMKLSTLLTDLRCELIGPDVDVVNVSSDSRRVDNGHAFVAVRGLRHDGHQFVANAIGRGARAVIVEDREAVVGDDATVVVVDNTAHALGHMAARLAGDPATKLTTIGITGTNGKTTVSYLVEAILAASGQQPATIGTVSYRYAGNSYPAPYTTPTPEVLQPLLAKIVDSGATHGVLEVSSAALAMKRLSGISFNVAAFTNLTQDHLDLHGDMATYCEAKSLLFSRELQTEGAAVINVDAHAADTMIRAAGTRRVIRVSSAGNPSDVRVANAESTIAGIKATIDTPRGPIAITSSALLGAYNVANIALAVGIAEALELPHTDIAEGIRGLAGVPGRVERVPNDHNLDILVDYAHTPDALSNLLAALKPLTGRRLLCVFGCGGDRDPSKRPAMGAAVAEHADLAIITSDNPRTEDPRAIIDMIRPSVPAAFFVDPDRRVAITAAVCEATPGDVVVIAGKGHEDYQILGTDKVHFDDAEEAALAANRRQSFAATDIAHTTNGVVIQTKQDSFTRITIDGRTAAAGDLYVAIRGETHDGHAFCEQAIQNGATGLLIEPGHDELGQLPATVIEAQDTRVALGELARAVRRNWAKSDRRIVAITGSAGKTTTKELIYAALSAWQRTHRSLGSLNNETGVPLTLLGLRDYHDMAVLEMGMRGHGQIAYLCEVAEPDIGIVLNAGVAHVGLLGSSGEIAKAKSEIYVGLPEYGCAVYPSNDARLAQAAKTNARALSFGDDESADVQLTSYQPAGTAGADVTFRVAERDYPVRVPLAGRHNAINAACAVAAAMAAGCPPHIAVTGLKNVVTPHMRGQVVSIAQRNIIVDCYNANPASANAALVNLNELRQQNTGIAIVGDMLELGDTAVDEHVTLGQRAGALGQQVIALGQFAAHVVSGARDAGAQASEANDPEHAASLALDWSRPGDWLLLKASRGIRLERVLTALRQRTGGGGSQ